MGGVGGFRGFGGGSGIQGVQVLPWAATLDLDLDHYNVFFTTAEYAISPVAHINAPIGGRPGQVFFVVLEQPADLCGFTYDSPGFRFNSNDWGEDLLPFLGHIYTQVILSFVRTEYEGFAWFTGSQIVTTTELRDEGNALLIEGHNGKVFVTAPKGMDVNASDHIDGNVLVTSEGTSGIGINSVRANIAINAIGTGAGTGAILINAKGSGDAIKILAEHGGILIRTDADPSGRVTIYSAGSGVTAIRLQAPNGSIRLEAASSGKIFLLCEHIDLSTSLPVYADNAAALSAGEASGAVYRTATGHLMVAYTP